MANEVNVTINADDKTGPAMVSAAAKMELLKKAFAGFGDNISKGMPLIENATGRFAALTGKVVLFGGALKLIPFMGAVAGWHLMADGAIEFAATLIPATVGLLAFGVAAIDTVQEITKHFQNMDIAVDETGQKVYPLTGAFTRMSDAVKPKVYQLLGEGLYVISKNAGFFQQVAVATGSVLDRLGARLTYAMTSGTGFNIFIKNSATDLAGWGDLIGNIGGIFGNFFKAMPGYAQIILNVADAFTHWIEVITGSKIGQWLINIGLWAHGAILYIGLLGSAFAFLASRGLAAAATLLLNTSVGLSKLGPLGRAAGDGMIKFAAGAERAAGLPWGWIFLIGTAVTVAAIEFYKATDTVYKFGSALQSVINNAPLNMLELTIAGAIGEANVQLEQQVTNYHKVAAAGGQMKLVHGIWVGQNADVAAARGQVQGYTGVLHSLQQEQMMVAGRLNELDKLYGGQTNALALLNAAGITTAQVTDTNNLHWAQAKIQIQAQADALKALSGGTGRYAAALNALSGPQQYLGDTLVNIQKITAAQDNLINNMIGGRTAFTTFQQDLITMGTDAKVAGTSLGGLNAQSLTLANDFYTTSVPAFQKIIDSLEQQMVGTKNLTTAVATGAGELLKFAGKNDEARAVIVAMINDALGPNTVSLKTLNTWIGHNSTSLQGFNAIIAEGTIKAGQLSNVLQNDLTRQFQLDLLASSGATADMKKFTDAVTHGGTQTAAFKGIRAQLIKDLESTGMSAHDATAYVDGLQKKIDALHGKSAKVTVDVGGMGGIKVTSPDYKYAQAILDFSGFGGYGYAGGGRVMSGAGPLADDNIIRVSRDETIVSAAHSRLLAPLFASLGIPGYAKGGRVGLGTPFLWAAKKGAGFAGDQGVHWAELAIKDFVDSFISNLGGGGGGPGPGGGNPALNRLLAKQLMPAWGVGEEWAAWDYLWNRESGWSQFAMNPTSMAYGIPQALPLTKMPKAAWPASMGGSSNPRAQEGWGIEYISGRYGNPFNAAQHELAYNWYDGGGWLKPGMNVMMNGTGAWEHLSRDSSPGKMVLEIAGGQTLFERFMAEFLREFVRIKGGGNVQTAFGGRAK